jgi:fructose-specific component phosphotransferase system IIB-like protein
MKAAALDSSGVASPENFLERDEYIGDLRDDVSSPDETQSHAITQQHDFVAFEPSQD